MSLGLRLSLLPLLIAGCASQLLVVPDSDWQTVPAPQRAAIDRQHEADVAAARAEITAASAGLAEVKRSQPAPIAAPPAPKPPAPAASNPAATGDDQIASRDRDQARGRAMAEVEAAKAAWQRADRTWRQLRLDAANERLAVLVVQRELVRAQTIDRNMVGTDTYNVAPLRGQFSRAQQRWHTAASNARQARDALAQASANLASAKEAYATLMRGGPLPSSQLSIALADRPPLQLTAWAVTRNDIRRRRGLRHFLDDGASPQLRGMVVRLNAKRDKPPAEPPRSNAPTTAPDAATKPGDRSAPPTSAAAGTSTNSKPAAGTAQGNAPAPVSNAVAKPAEHPASPTNSANISATAKPPTDVER